MATEQAIFELDIIVSGEGETKTVKGELESIEDVLRNIKKDAKDQTAKKAFAALNKVVDESVLSIQELGTAADNYKNIAIAAGTETPIGKEALKQAGQLEKQIDVLNQRTTKLAENGKALQASMELGTSVIAGYSVFAGTQALFGQENEKLQETFVKLQAAQSALMGLQELKTALDRNSILVTTAKFVAEKVSTAATYAMATAQGILNAVMMANPIFLIVAALGALSLAFEPVRDAIMGLIDFALKPFMIGFELAIEAVEWLGSALGLTASKAEKAAARQAAAAEKAARAQIEASIKAQKEIVKNLETVRKARQDAFDFEIAKLSAAGERTFEVEQEKLRFVLESVKKQREALSKQFEFEKQLLERKLKSASIFNQEAFEVQQKRLTKLREEEIASLKQRGIDAEQQLELNNITEQKNIDDAAKERQDKANEAWKKSQEEKEKQRQKEAEEAEKAAEKLKEAQRKEAEEKQAEKDEEFRVLIEQQKLIDDINLQLMQEGFDKERALRQEEFDKRIAELEEKGLLTAELEKGIKTQLINDLNEIDAQQKEAKEAQEQEAKQNKIEREQSLQDAILSIQNSAFSSIRSITDLSVKDQQKAEKIKKKIAVAELAVNTARAISGAIAMAQSVPFPGNLVAIATGVSTVLANMVQAKQLLSQAGASTGSIGSASSAASSGSSTQIVNDSSDVGGEVNTDPNSLINRDRIVMPIESMTDGQQRMAQLEEQSTV